LSCPVPLEFANFPVLEAGETEKFASSEEANMLVVSIQSGPVNDNTRLLADLPLPLVAVKVPSPLQHDPPRLPVPTQSSMFTVTSAVQFKLPSDDCSVPPKVVHSHRRAEAKQIAPEQVPKRAGAVSFELPRILNNLPKGPAVGVAEGTVVGTGTVVGVAEVETSGNTPWPHPDSGIIAKVKAASARIGRKRTIIAAVPRLRRTLAGVLAMGSTGETDFIWRMRNQNWIENGSGRTLPPR